MNSVAVVGAGLMGTPIAWALNKLGHEVCLVEIDKQKTEAALEKLTLKINDPLDGIKTFDNIVGLPKRFKTVISAAPYAHCYNIAEFCFNSGRNYCDLGGNPDVSNKIQELFYKIERTSSGLTDLGLAPGLVNILGEYFCLNHKFDTVTMMCGGLPKEPIGKFKYSPTFNVDGLYNEYRGECLILQDGVEATVPALSGEEEIDGFVAFHTKGGISSLNSWKEYGVKNCCYKTLRYPGHLEIIKVLLDDCEMIPEQFAEIINRKCPRNVPDVIYIKIIGSNSEKQKSISCNIESNDDWSGMQMATAFPAAVAASMISEDEMKNKNSILFYKDIHFAKYFDKLATLLPTIDLLEIS